VKPGKARALKRDLKVSGNADDFPTCPISQEDSPLPRRLKQPKPKVDPQPVIPAQLVKAFGHPLRVQILEFLAREAGSARTISAALDAPLGNVAYHLNKVLGRECKIVEVVKTRQVRGATESFYRIDESAILGRIQWPVVPGPLRAGIKGASLVAFLTNVVAALETGSMETRTDTTLQWMPAPVDETGWNEVREAMVEVGERIELAIEESATRLQDRDAIHTIIGLAAFVATPLPDHHQKDGS
jgi:DNA-binding transcriptional ArsR family regulator